jgi:hypothetical protein
MIYMICIELCIRIYIDIYIYVYVSCIWYYRWFVFYLYWLILMHPVQFCHKFGDSHVISINNNRASCAYFKYTWYFRNPQWWWDYHTLICFVLTMAHVLNVQATESAGCTAKPETHHRSSFWILVPPSYKQIIIPLTLDILYIYITYKPEL